MADIDYPSSLTAAVRSTKQITKGGGFLESSPSAGASYTQAYTNDQPVFLTFDLRFTDSQAMLFDSWAAVNKIFDQGLFFNFPVRDQYGLFIQEVRFISTGVPTYSETGATVGYSGCQVIIPNYFSPDKEFIYDFLQSGKDISELGYLDLAINRDWPNE